MRIAVPRWRLAGARVERAVEVLAIRRWGRNVGNTMLSHNAIFAKGYIREDYRAQRAGACIR